MQYDTTIAITPHRTPWNKGKLTGAKPPLQAKHVWLIRTKLQVEGRDRDLAMFNLAIDSKLRGCDVVALKVADVAPKGHALERASIRQQKTGQPVRFELTQQSRKRSMSMCGLPIGSLANSYLTAIPVLGGVSPPGNTPVWFLSGSPASDWIRACSERIRYDEPKRP